MRLGMQFISRTLTQKTQGPACHSIKTCKLLGKSENLVKKKKKKIKKKPYTQITLILDSMFKNKSLVQDVVDTATSANGIRGIILCLKHSMVLNNKE